MTSLAPALAIALCILACSCKASPIFRTDSSTDLVAVQETTTELAVSQTTDLALPSTKEIDTLTEDETSVRVKRQGGCGCCCCRPCCCCCKPCCCCCRCCCCRCCCCRPCCCCCRCCRCCCCRPCCCGCGCCGCGGGRKRRALQNLRVALLNKNEKESKTLPLALPASADKTEEVAEDVHIQQESSTTPSASSIDDKMLYGDVSEISHFDN